MDNWRKYALMAAIIILAGFAYTRSSHRNIPSDLRDAVGEEAATDEFDALLGPKALHITPASKVPVPVVDKNYAVVNNPQAGKPGVPVEYILIKGGDFKMGNGYEDAEPVHKVAIKTFEMAKTAVTVEQYGECVIKGQCTAPGTGEDTCNWGKPDMEHQPVNCVDWAQADQYAKFKGARLPSESEWEYAASSRGKKHPYPWGNKDPSCERAVIYGIHSKFGCNSVRTMRVCSKTYGNTEQGLCDMVGNVMQWVQDTYQNSYRGAPADGSAVERDMSRRVLRGGILGYNAEGKRKSEIQYLSAGVTANRDSELESLAVSLKVYYRVGEDPRNRSPYLGFRLARSVGSPR